MRPPASRHTGVLCALVMLALGWPALLAPAARAGSDADGIPDAVDNCIAEPNGPLAGPHNQLDSDGDGFGNVCDADLDQDGVVGPSDYFGGFRACMGADLLASPLCEAADFDGDGNVGNSDFFGLLRPAFGTAPGPRCDACPLPAGVCGDGVVNPGEACEPGAAATCAAGDVCGASCLCQPAGALAGARSFKSGPIQITADGAFVWLVNPDHDSVTRIRTADDAVDEFALPLREVAHHPTGLAVTEDGSRVFVACQGSDRVFVLDGPTGALVKEIKLPWGSGPHALALSPDQSRALVTLFRSRQLAVLDAAGLRVSQRLGPVFHAPRAVAWTLDGADAWVTHLFVEEEHPTLTRVDFRGAVPRVASRIRTFPAKPHFASEVQAPSGLPDGGYLTFRGHPAQIPPVTGRREIWLPTQYANQTTDVPTPDSTFQAVIRHLDLDTHRVLESNADKVILTAVEVHDPIGPPFAFAGPGWNAKVAAPVDIAFAADGSTLVMAFEASNDVMVLPTDLPAVRPPGAAALVEIGVGDRPTGLVLSPTTGLVYVANQLSRDVSVVDPVARVELRRIAATPGTPEPLDPTFLLGAKLFHTSDDPRTSSGKAACASCHQLGERDGRRWDNQNLPGLHGPRFTQNLLGLAEIFGPADAATGFGQLHRSGDRDEVQDFELAFQGVQMGGSGFLGGAVQPELGAPNAGRSAELDAVALYSLSLPAVARSPMRAPDGSLDEAAVRGASFFVGASGRPADAGCAGCHPPETGFSDRRFHDVGQRRPAEEQELGHASRAPFQWQVNTPGLRGLFTTTAFVGAAGFPTTAEELVRDLAGRFGHGTAGGLSGRQIRDLTRFLLSIDGDLDAATVRGARDVQPPRVVRVEPASATRVDVWFSETVDPTSAEDPANWTLHQVGGATIPVLGATRDDLNGDRVQLRFAGLPKGGTVYALVPGPILDVAGSASGGTSNALDVSDGSNVKGFVLGDSLTVTLGESGYENLTIRSHDAGTAGPPLPYWGHDSPRLESFDGVMNKGFVRFDWRDVFVQATGVASAAAIEEVGFELEPEWGDSQSIEIRRVLQPWSDDDRLKDFDGNPVGQPTWLHHSFPGGAWNEVAAEASAPGVQGDVRSDYQGAFDLAEAPDAVVSMQSIDQPLAFAGGAVTEAFRFWFDNPDLDFGYALQLAPGSTQETLFEHRERRREGHRGPVLRIRYTLP